MDKWGVKKRQYTFEEEKNEYFSYVEKKGEKVIYFWRRDEGLCHWKEIWVGICWSTDLKKNGGEYNIFLYEWEEKLHELCIYIIDQNIFSINTSSCR
jgi:hypothetical protein